MRNKLLAIVGVIAVFAMAGIASAQTNLLVNGNLSQDDGVDPLNAFGWTEVNNGGWVNREANANGTYGSATNEHYAMGNAGAINNYAYQEVAGTNGTSYQLDFDMAMDDWWTPTAFASIEFYDASFTFISSNRLEIAALGYDAAVGRPWTNYFIAGAAPAGTAWVRAVLGGSTPGEDGIPGHGGGTIRFDNLALTSFSTVADTDSDGLPDYWENNNGLDPYDDGTTNSVNGASGDPDGDLLVNIDEFNGGVDSTDPQNPDTDGDGLTDGDEVNITLTDPLDADSDNDGLLDGEEVNTHLTDPFLADSDSDGANDATEVYAGSDPNVGASLPANARPDEIGIDSFYYRNGAFGPQGGGELFDYDNTTSTDAYTGHTGSSSGWDVVWGTPYITAGRLETRDAAVIRGLNGTATGGDDVALFAQQAISPEVDSQVLYAKVDMTLEAGVLWGGLSLFATGEEEIFFGVGEDISSNIVFKLEESGIATNFSAIAATNDQTYTLVVAMDAASGSVSLWVDPVLSSPEPGADMDMLSVASTNLRCSAVRLASGGSGAILWDNLVVGKTWDSLSTTDSDSDSDGLPDAWEIYYGLDPNDDGTTSITNGPIGDPDIDTLVNSNELTLGTDPVLADTDYDGLTDDVEVNTTLSDPLVWDTDGDGLNDGDEVTNHFTNPLLADTDLDGEDDAFELFQGTDPNDILSTSASEGVAIVDGTVDAAYGAAISVQTLNTAWIDNVDELDAAYAYVKNDRLYLMITGNMNTNWNKLEIFIDSSDAVTTNVLTATGFDSTTNMNGLVFDAGFSPDYHMNVRVGSWEGFDGFSFNMAYYDLATTNQSYHENAFADSIEGSAFMGPGDVNSETVAFAFNNTNLLGVISGTDAANQTAAAAVATGFECSIALADLGNPAGEIRILAMIATDEHATLGNQFLPGLPAPQNALGATTNVNFNNIAGDQFFTVNVPLAVAAEIVSGQLVSGNTLFELNVSKLVAGFDYKVQETADLSTAFSDVPGSDWTAANTNELKTVPADTVANPVMFYQVVAP